MIRRVNTIDVVEVAKLGIRRGLTWGNFAVQRDPPMSRLARALKAHNISLVLDVGANVGQFAYLLRKSGYRESIRSFEPLPNAFGALSRRAARSRRWTAFHSAVGERNGTISINVSQNSYSSSVRKMEQAHLEAAPRSRYIEKIEVPITSLLSHRSDFPFDPLRTLLKIDTQGYEAEVLQGAGGMVYELAAIQVEMSLVPLYRGQELFDEMRQRMATYGLALYGLEPGIADARGRMLQCDGLFVRRSLLS